MVSLMGRMWNALRRSANTAEEPRAPIAPSDDDEERLAATEEIPFIEVGPRKSIEASPSVLACSPNTAVPSLAIRASETPEVGKKLALRSVPFRAVFLATPETEPEMPQNNSIILS